MPKSAGNSSLEAIWGDLTPPQKKYVVAYQRHTSKADAAKEIGRSASTIYSWPDKVDHAAELFSDATAELAMQELEEALVEAAMVKTQEVRRPGSTQENQQDAATDIMDRVMGKPTQKQEVDMQGEVEVESDSLDDAIDQLTAAAEQFGDE